MSKIKKKYSYWKRRDGSKYRAVTILERIGRTKQFRPVEKKRYRFVKPKKKKSYWRKVRDEKVKKWKGSVSAMVQIVYKYSKDVRSKMDEVDAEIMASSEKELSNKIRYIAEHQFLDRFTGDDPVSVISNKIHKVYRARPPLPSDWDVED